MCIRIVVMFAVLAAQALQAGAVSFAPEQVLVDGAIQGRYARAIAIDGARMVIGAPGERVSDAVPSGGALHVYARAGRFWVREARIVAAQAGNGTMLGEHVAIAGDRIIASAGSDAAGGAGLYVFNRIGGAWIEETKLVPPPGVGPFPVAVSGDTIAAGSPNAGGGGVVHVYARGTGWALQQTLVHSLGSQADCGHAVAIRGERALVGCFLAQRPSLSGAGAALVYRRSGASWTIEATLTAADATPNQRFGSAVALSDTEALIGAPATDTFLTTTGQPGAAYFFVRNETAWQAGPKLVPGDSTAGDFFGYAVDLAGATAVLAAPHLHISGEPATERGAAYAFLRNGLAWSEAGKLQNDDGAIGDLFGIDVAAATDAFVIGAHASVASGTNAGAGFHFTRQGLAETGATALEGNADDLRGTAVATAGAFMIIGGPNVEVGANADQGVVTIHEKVAGSYVVRQTLVASDGRTGDKFGASVAANDTGTVIAVGAPGVDAGPNLDAGTAFVFERVAGTWTEVARLDDIGSTFNARIGSAIAVSAVGDIVLVGAPNYDQARGRVLQYVRTGPPPPGPKGTVAWQLTQIVARPSGQRIGDKWGASIALHGTMLAVGAPGAANAGGDANHGLVQVLKPSGSQWVPHTPELRDASLGGPDQTRFGTSVAVHGTDLAVGAPDTDVAPSTGPMQLDQGTVATYVVEPTGTAAPQQAFTSSNGRIGDKFGAALGAGDGVLVVGAPLAPAGDGAGGNVDGQGIAYVFRASRPPGGLIRWLEDQQISIAPSNTSSGDQFGGAVAIRGGVIVVGAARRDFPESGPKALVRDVGAAFGFADVANLVFANGFE